MKYSLVVCARNEEQNVAELLTSVSNLTIPDGVILEVILVDDGSNDRTVGVASATMQKGLRIVKGHGDGVATSRNKGIAASSGDFILFCDCDGVLNADCLVEVHRLASSPRQPDVIQGNIWAQYHDTWVNRYLSRWREVVFKDLMAKSDGTLRGFHGRLVAIRRSFLRDLAPSGEAFDSSLSGSGGEDLECGRRAHSAGAIILLAENAILYHKDTDELIPLLRKKFRSGVADAKAGVEQRLFDRRNFYRAVIKPTKQGVPLWFSFVSWLSFIGGCVLGRRTVVTQTVGLSVDSLTVKR